MKTTYWSWFVIRALTCAALVCLVALVATEGNAVVSASCGLIAGGISALDHYFRIPATEDGVWAVMPMVNYSSALELKAEIERRLGINPYSRRKVKLGSVLSHIRSLQTKELLEIVPVQSNSPAKYRRIPQF
jgi:hypothetical protein